MSLNKAVYQYQQSSVFTATPEELTLMLYNGCIKAIRFAGVSIDDKNYEKANYYICKAEAIIRELRNTLDMKYEISENLYNLYTYFLNRLIEANIKKDKSILEEVLRFVEEIRDTWSQAMKDARIQNAQGHSDHIAQNI